jgi:predicted acylesterase/phospholipase RssA
MKSLYIVEIISVYYLHRNSSESRIDVVVLVSQVPAQGATYRKYVRCPFSAVRLCLVGRGFWIATGGTRLSSPFDARVRGRTMKVNGVFQGGGVKGIGLVGALRRVEQQENVEFEGLAGTSAGAIVAALYAAGYTTEELRELLLETDFMTLLDAPRFRSLQLWRRYGIHKGQKLYRWLYELLREKGVVKFEDLKDRDVKIIAADIRKKEVLVFDKKSHPSLEVAAAIRMSLSIPLFFEAYRHDQSLVVDGGLLTNYPLWVFADAKEPTIGFKLVSKNTEVPEAPRSFPDFLISLVTTMLDAHDKEDEKKLDQVYTIHIPTYDVATTNFSLSREKKQLLYQAGYVAASEYILKSEFFKKQSESSAPTSSRSGSGYTVYESLERLRSAPSSLRDKAFRTTEFRETVIIDKPNAEVEIVETLVNESEQSQTGLVRWIATDAPTDKMNLQWKAWFSLDGEEKEAWTKVDESSDHKLFTAHLGFKGQIIQKGKTVRVRRSYKMPGSVSLNEDYWVFGLNYSERPIDAVSLEVVFARDPVDYGFFSHTDSGLKPLYLAGPIPRTIRDRTWFVYSTKILSPVDLYLLRWLVE